MKISYQLLLLFIFMASLGNLCSCSSMMAHTSDDQGYYPGTRANNQTISNSHQSWALTSMAVLDYPFSVILDTLLLPWDYLHKNSHQRQSLKSQVDKLDPPAQRK